MLICERTIWTPDNCYLLEYKARCEAGEFIIGQELWLELSNLAEDLRNDRYIYDRETALLRLDFMANCVRLTKSPYYNQPMVLMLWQKALIETAYSFKMAEESREAGFWIDRFQEVLLLIARKNTKTETCSALALAEFITGPEGADLVCASNDNKVLYDFFMTGTYDKNRESMEMHKSIGYYVLKFFNGVCHVYLTVRLSTPCAA